MTEIKYKDTDIAIVGMACIFPGAPNIDQYWHNLVNGVDSITEAPPMRIDPMYFQKNGEAPAYDRFYCSRGGFCQIPVIDPTRFGFLPIAARGMEPEHLFAMKVAYEALEDAGVFEKNISLKNCCVVLGKGNFGSLSSMRNIDIVNTSVQVAQVVKACLPGISDEDLEKIRKAYQDEKGSIKPDNAIALMPNMIAALITNKLDMHGPAYTVDGACASSAIAINQASDLLLSGQCDIALAGGIHAGQSAMFWASFNMLGAMSRKGVISPFSEDADGLLIGEGGGVLVLKTMKKAIEDNDRVYSVIKASAIYSDGSGVSVMAPNTEGQQRTLEIAWNRSGMNPEHIGLIEAHGTATIAGDKVEINTLNEFFGKNPSLNKVWLGSVKSNIGHTMPAAGIAGVIKTALALYNRKIPPTLHAEKPAKALLDSRFLLPQTAIDWTDDKYPLVAGVNAFGFGGINSHVIMTACDNEHRVEALDVKVTIKRSFKDAMLIGADSKEELLNKLDKRNHIGSNGKYRLVIFDPTDERIQKARAIVEKDKPWLGRMDIWFSNKPLLQQDGKLAFLFSGFNMETNAEVNTIADYFGMERPRDIAEYGLLNHSLKLYYVSNIFDTALKKLGVVPDMNAGHSIGEWHANKASDMLTDENVKKMIHTWVKDLDQEIDDNSQSPDDDYDSHLEDVYFVAVSCGYERLKPIVNDIPELYLANDNCNNQVLMCGRREAVDEMTKRLNKEHILSAEMPYKSGYHTPFISKHVGLLDYCIAQIEELKEPKIPVWSATTLEQYPTDLDEYRKLTAKHLTSHIRFRELIEKLYEQENARVFIQIGSGPLTGFVNDTLGDKEYSIISTHNSQKSGIEQLRRVLAHLYVEGKKVDTLFVRNGEISLIIGQEFEVDSFSPIVEDFPLINEVVKKQRTLDFTAFDEEPEGKLLSKKVNENIREMSLVQKDMFDILNEVKILEQKFNLGDIQQTHNRPTPEKETTAKAQSSKEREEKTVPKKSPDTDEIFITLQEHPYLVDHTILDQPENWPHPEDSEIVIPMTMTMELIMDTAKKHAPSQKILCLSSFGIFQWMNLGAGFMLALKNSRISDNIIKLEMSNFATAEVKIGDNFDTPSAKYTGNIDLGEVIQESPTKAYIYDEIMFHGPLYQGVTEITSVNKNGMTAMVRNAGGKGSLLDTLGQLIGVYLKITVADDNVSFPVSVNKISFYQDFRDQEGDFEFTLIVNEINEDLIVGDMILKRDGKVWCIAENWLNKRFEMDTALWNAINKPLGNKLSKEIEGTPVQYFDQAYTRTGSWNFIEKRYLNYLEKQHYKSLMLNKRREYVISRVAIKDTIRTFILDKYGKNSYPVEIFIEHNDDGKPFAHGIEELKNLEISIAHKGNESVALVADTPVGVDIELVEERSIDFIDMAFTETEQNLLKDKEISEWSTRFWAAKEAYGKMKGVGLKGNPKRYKIEKIEGESLFIDGEEIRTVKHKDKYIVAWIQQL